MMTSGAEWKEVKLGDILRRLDQRVLMNDEKEYLTITVRRRHGGLDIREKLFGHQIVTKKQFGLVPGAFIISRVQCWHQAYAIVGYVPPNTIASQNYDQFAISPAVDSRFFWWLSHSPSFTETVRSSAVGVVIEKMVFNRDEWLKKTVCVPALAEQHRVVARIEELATQIRDARALRRRAADEAEALMAARTTYLFDQLNGCSRVAMRTLGKGGANPIQTGPFGAQLHASEFVNAGIPVLNVGNVWPEGLRLENLDHVLADKAAQLRRYSLSTGDLLFARSGATLGKVCLVPEECDGWLMTGHLFRVRLDAHRIDNRYAFAAFRGARSVHEQVFGQVRGATRPGFNTTLLGNVELPLVPLKVQRRIVAELDALQAEVDALKRLQAETAAELDALLPAILDKAFKGEL
jgi:type I restriction enzyme, S subunit